MLLSELFMPKNYRTTFFNLIRSMGLDVAMGYPGPPPGLFRQRSQAHGLWAQASKEIPRHETHPLQGRDDADREGVLMHSTKSPTEEKAAELNNELNFRVTAVADALVDRAKIRAIRNNRSFSKGVWTGLVIGGLLLGGIGYLAGLAGSDMETVRKGRDIERAELTAKLEKAINVVRCTEIKELNINVFPVGDGTAAVALRDKKLTKE